MRTIYRLCPAGVDEDNMFCMALALHLKELKPTSPHRNENDMYNFKASDRSKCQYYVACQILQKTQKFRLGMENHVPVAANRAEHLTAIAEVLERHQENEENIIDEPLPRTTTRWSADRGGHGGRKAEMDRVERALREKERRVALASIGNSMKRKSSAMEESNALMAFRMPLGNETAEDAVVRDSFPCSIRQNHKLIAGAARDASEKSDSAARARTLGVVPATENPSSPPNLLSTLEEQNVNTIGNVNESV